MTRKNKQARRWRIDAHLKALFAWRAARRQQALTKWCGAAVYIIAQHLSNISGYDVTSGIAQA